jgi:ubiquinone/menaquinone biosynthesis C-methylase UbiE
MNIIPQRLINRNTSWKTDLLSNYINESTSVLDFGCGDLSLAESLKKKNKKLKITGIDVVDFSRNVPGITFIRYDGTKLPFKNNSFDTVISFYVFHHCDDAMKSFQECFRVAKKRVIFIEPVKRYAFEKYLMGVIDYLYNVWKRESIPYTDQFFTLSEWKKVLKKSGGYKATPLRSFFPIPIGKAYVFEAIKKKL